MNKKTLFCCLVLLLFIAGCSSNTNSLEQAPPHIKETWGFFEDMSKTTDAVSNGEHVEIAFEKHFSNRSEVYSYIESATAETEEEDLVYSYIYLMYLDLTNLATESAIASGTVDVEQYVYDLQVPRYELEKVYEKYGLVYEGEN